MVVPVPLLIRKVFMKRFLKAGAVDDQHAVRPEDIRVYQNLIFSRLVARGKIVNAGGGKFYVDTSKL